MGALGLCRQGLRTLAERNRAVNSQQPVPLTLTGGGLFYTKRQGIHYNETTGFQFDPLQSGVNLPFRWYRQQAG